MDETTAETITNANSNTTSVTNTVISNGTKKKKQAANNNANSTDNTTADTNANSNTSGETITGTDATTLRIEDIAGQVNFNSPTWDMFLIGFFVVGALLYGMSLGKDRIIAIMMSIYMALAVVATLPAFVLNVRVNESYTVQITAFFAVFVVLFFLLSRQAVLNALSPSGEGKWWQTLLFSLLHVGLLVSVTLSYLPVTMLSKFSPFTVLLFTAEWARFGWIIAPIVAMMIVGKNRE